MNRQLGKRIVRVVFLTAAGFGLIILCLSAFAWVYLSNSLQAETYGEITFNKSLAAVVAAEVQAGKLHPDKAGQVSLAPPLRAAACEGIVTADHGKRGLLLLFFPTRRERFGARGYLYCSRPLMAADTVPISGGRGIMIQSSEHPSNDGITTHGLGHVIIVPLTKQLDAHWWRVVAPDVEV